MPISKAAIEAFLCKVHAELPAFKGVPAEDLKRIIYGASGAPYSERTPSRPYQLEGTAAAVYLRRAMLFYWMRSGKSKMAVDWAAQLRRAGLAKKPGLIIAHAPIGADVWEDQVSRHSELSAAVVRSGKSAGDHFAEALYENFDLIIISRSTIQALFTTKRDNRKGIPTLYPVPDLLQTAAECFDHCIIDETHFYSNPFALPFLLSKGLIAQCKYRLGLTGTPIGRDPFKIWAQAYLIDEGAHFGFNYRFFQEAFGKSVYQHFRGGKYGYQFDKAKLPQFKYKLDSFSLSRGKEDIKQAEVIKNEISLKMKGDQRDAYNDEITRMIKIQRDDGDLVRASFVRLRQIASGYLPVEDEAGTKLRAEFRNVKLEWLREFISEVSDDTRCLFFHEFIYSGEMICKTLTTAKISHSWIAGGRDNKAELARFKSGKARFLVANNVTGGTAIDLPEVDYLCFFESPVSPITRAQAESRPMARERALMLDDLVCAPVERKILRFIADGEDMLRDLLRSGGKSARDLFA